MIYVEMTNNLELVREIASDPFIFNRMKEEGDELKDFQIEYNSNIFWLLVKEGFENIGIIFLRKNSSIVGEVHFFMKDRERPKAFDAGKAFYKFILLATEFKKIVANIPIVYNEVYEFTKKMGFSEEGMIKDSYLFNKELVDMYAMGISEGKMKEVAL